MELVPQILSIVGKEEMNIARQTFMFSDVYSEDVRRLADDFLTKNYFYIDAVTGIENSDWEWEALWLTDQEDEVFEEEFIMSWIKDIATNGGERQLLSYSVLEFLEAEIRKEMSPFKIAFKMETVSLLRGMCNEMAEPNTKLGTSPSLQVQHSSRLDVFVAARKFQYLCVKVLNALDIDDSEDEIQKVLDAFDIDEMTCLERVVSEISSEVIKAVAIRNQPRKLFNGQILHQVYSASVSKSFVGPPIDRKSQQNGVFDLTFFKDSKNVRDATLQGKHYPRVATTLRAIHLLKYFEYFAELMREPAESINFEELLKSQITLAVSIIRSFVEVGSVVVVYQPSIDFCNSFKALNGYTVNYASCEAGVRNYWRYEPEKINILVIDNQSLSIESDLFEVLPSLYKYPADVKLVAIDFGITISDPSLASAAPAATAKGAAAAAAAAASSSSADVEQLDLIVAISKSLEEPLCMFNEGSVRDFKVGNETISLYGKSTYLTYYYYTSIP